MAALRKTKSSLTTVDRIIGKSAWARSIRDEIESVAGYDAGVLITGPTGTGKELIAQAVHMAGDRADKPFIAADCAALPASLFASQVFGHTKGAFTGASYSALGCFRAADGGTIFLDEIGELELSLQANLLRVLQTRQVVPLGSHDGVPVDVRVIAATNRDLEEEIRQGRFREDLFYRLNVINLRTQPLRTRPDDIEVLVRFFLDRLAVNHGVTRRLSPGALRLLHAHDWPGNVRELENRLERAAISASGEVICVDGFTDIAERVLGTDRLDAACPKPPATANGSCSPAKMATTFAPSTSESDTNEESWVKLDDLERAHIEQTLHHTFYNQSAAARMLGVTLRVLRGKISRYGIDVSASHPGRRPK